MLQLSQPGSEVFIPDHRAWDQAAGRVTHLVIAAHADDVELMAWHAVQECLTPSGNALCAVIVGDGRGSSRTGRYAQVTDTQMRDIRLGEQKQAATLGGYAALIWLDHASANIKVPAHAALQADLAAVLAAVNARTVYTHSPVDKHDTHVAVALHAIHALRRQKSAAERVLGCEVWRGLDWLQTEDKVALDVSGVAERMMPLMAAFDSQISGGKRYDLAAAGRKSANATFLDSHAADRASAVEYAIDLTALVRDPGLDITQWTLHFVERFAADVRERLQRMGGPPWK